MSAIPLPGVAPASADDVASGDAGSLHTGTASQEAKITAESATIHRLTTAYQQAELQSTTLGQQITTDRNSLRKLQAAVASSQSDLRQAAVRAYTVGVSTAPPVLRIDPAIGLEYLTVATGDLQDVVDQLSLRQRQVRTDELQLRQEHEGNHFAVTNAEKARRQALAVATDEQNRLDALQRRLQQLRVEVVTGARARGAAQGPPVDNGLVRSVESQVSATPPAIAAQETQVGGSVTTSLAELRMCESSDNYASNTGDGFYGAYQLTQSTWRGLGYPGRPDRAPPTMQDHAAARLVTTGGWSQWPACSVALGL